MLRCLTITGVCWPSSMGIEGKGVPSSSPWTSGTFATNSCKNWYWLSAKMQALLQNIRNALFMEADLRRVLSYRCEVVKVLALRAFVISLEFFTRVSTNNSRALAVKWIKENYRKYTQTNILVKDTYNNRYWSCNFANFIVSLHYLLNACLGKNYKQQYSYYPLMSFS